MNKRKNEIFQKGMLMKKLTIFLIVSVFFISCSKEIKTVSDESKIAMEAINLVEKIKELYKEQNRSSIREITTKEGYDAVIKDIKVFELVELEFTPAFVEIKDNAVFLHINWSSKWQKIGDTFDEKGVAVFILKGNPLKLDNILRTNPFKYPL